MIFQPSLRCTGYRSRSAPQNDAPCGGWAAPSAADRTAPGLINRVLVRVFTLIWYIFIKHWMHHDVCVAEVFLCDPGPCWTCDLLTWGCFANKVWRNLKTLVQTWTEPKCLKFADGYLFLSLFGQDRMLASVTGGRCVRINFSQTRFSPLFKCLQFVLPPQRFPALA